MDKEGLIPPELFYVGLTVWVSSDPLGLAASQANFYPPPPEWLHDKYDTTGENLRSESQGSQQEPQPGPTQAHGPYPKALPTAPYAHWPPLPLPDAPSPPQSRRPSLWSLLSSPSYCTASRRLQTSWRPSRGPGQHARRQAGLGCVPTPVAPPSSSGSSIWACGAASCWLSASCWYALTSSVPCCCSTPGRLA